MKRFGDFIFVDNRLKKTDPASKKMGKDDKPHAPNSPEDTAHDVTEEGLPLKDAMARIKDAKEKAKAIAHLRSAKEEPRSPKNEAAGQEDLKKDPADGLVATTDSQRVIKTGDTDPMLMSMNQKKELEKARAKKESTSDDHPNAHLEGDFTAEETGLSHPTFAPDSKDFNHKGDFKGEATTYPKIKKNEVSSTKAEAKANHSLTPKGAATPKATAPTITNPLHTSKPNQAKTQAVAAPHAPKMAKAEVQPNPGPSKSKHQETFDAKTQAASEAHLKTPAGDKERQEGNKKRMAKARPEINYDANPKALSFNKQKELEKNDPKISGTKIESQMSGELGNTAKPDESSLKPLKDQKKPESIATPLKKSTPKTNDWLHGNPNAKPLK